MTFRTRESRGNRLSWRAIDCIATARIRIRADLAWARNSLPHWCHLLMLRCRAGRTIRTMGETICGFANHHPDCNRNPFRHDVGAGGHECPRAQRRWRIRRPDRTGGGDRQRRRSHPGWARNEKEPLHLSRSRYTENLGSALSRRLIGFGCHGRRRAAANSASSALSPVASRNRCLRGAGIAAVATGGHGLEPAD